MSVFLLLSWYINLLAGASWGMMRAMGSLTWHAPAKVNLYLHVLDRRPDGYHEIDSLMVPLDLSDTIIARSGRRGIEVRCPGHEELDQEANLAYQTAAAYQEKSGEKLAVSFEIRKAIPIQAGLGGGSSDAGAVLQILQKMVKHPLSEDELDRLATSLGADVPFFLRGTPCLARGIGEKLEPAPKLPDFWLILACAPFGLSTREVYENLKYSLTFPRNNTNNQQLVSAWAYDQLVSLLHNDLQPIGEKRYPVIAKVREEMLRSGASGSLVSGSGPTVFGIFPTPEQALAARERMTKERDWKYLVARGLTSGKRGDA